MSFHSKVSGAIGTKKGSGILPKLETLESRWNPAGTGLAGNITQGNLYGGQSVVLALPLAASKTVDTQIQIIDTGDSGIGATTVNSLVPFPGYKGPLNLAVGDFLNKGYQQLIVSASGQRVASHVMVIDLFQTMTNKLQSNNPNAAFKPVVIRNFAPFEPGFLGGAVVAAGDFNGDGLDDLAVGAGPGGGPHVMVYSKGDNKDPLRSFFAFDARFKGGVSLAAGHFDGDRFGDLIVGAGSGGGSRVAVFSGPDIHARAGNPRPSFSYWAFGNGRNNRVDSPVSVQLIESIVAPEPIPNIPPDRSPFLTPLFTPANNAPLITGTIAAFHPQSLNGLVSLGTPQSGGRTKVSMVTMNAPNTPIFMAPVGYMFMNSTKKAKDPFPPPHPEKLPSYTVTNNAAPMVLVANPGDSTISLYPLDQGKGKTVQPIQNIYNTTDSSNRVRYSHSFPFGAQFGTKGSSTTGSLATAVTTTYSLMANVAVAGTAGKLPARQVAYQSPFPLTFAHSLDSLFSDFSKSPWNDPTLQTKTALTDWYRSDRSTPDTLGDFEYGPFVDGDFPKPAIPADLTTPEERVSFLQERMVATGLQLMNRGYAYQHHHMPAWFQPINGQAQNQSDITNYDVYSLTPPGMQTPGLDCSDFTGFITNFGLGFRIPTGVGKQGAVASSANPGATTQGTADKDGNTQWEIDGKLLPFDEQGSLVRINNDSKQRPLDKKYVQNYLSNHGALATYDMLNSTLHKGDLLYYDPGDGKAVHVTMWLGETVPGTSVPLVMDSHGGAVQVGVNSEGSPTGVVAPSGPQIRPWFIPADTASKAADFYYFNNLFHVIRLNALNTEKKTG